MLTSICNWYEAYTLAILHWYTNHPVILVSSLVGSALIGIAVSVGAIYLAKKEIDKIIE